MSAPLRLRLPWTELAITAAAVWALAVAAAVLTAGSMLVGTVAVLAALLAAGFAAGAARQRRGDLARLSGDLTAVSERLVLLEGRGLDPSSEALADLRSLTQGLASYLDVVGPALTQLGGRVGEHDRRLGRAEDALAGGPAAARDPYRLDPSRLERQDDFAHATDLLVRHLTAAPAATAPVIREPPATPRETLPPIAAVPRTGIEHGIVLDALEAGRVELHLRPVVTLPQRRTRLYDALPRLWDAGGAIQPDADVAEALDRHGRRSALDEVVLAKSVAVARHLIARESQAAIGVPVSPRALGSTAFLEGVSRLLGGDRAVGKRLVFALRQRDLRLLGAGETAGIARLREFGAALKLDGIDGLDTDWADLVRRGFDFASIDCGLILETRPPGETGRLVQASRNAGLELIAAAVDAERLVPDLLDHDVPLAEGPALGAIRPVRAEILAGTAPLPERAPPIPEAGGGFRDYLRRAG